MRNGKTVTHIDTVHAMYAAFGQGDIETILDHLAEDVVWDQDAPSYGIAIYEPGTGKAHVRRFFQALNEIELLRFEPTNVLSGGNQVAVPINIRVRMKSGAVVEGLEIHLWTFAPDGRVSRFCHVVDRHAFVLACRPTAVTV